VIQNISDKYCATQAFFRKSQILPELYPFHTLSELGCNLGLVPGVTISLAIVLFFLLIALAIQIMVPDVAYSFVTHQSLYFNHHEVVCDDTKN
jgi:hypothetical protein